MADELTMGFSMSYEDSFGVSQSFSITDILKSVSTKRYFRTVQNVGTSEEAVLLGDITAPGYAIFHNLDPTNFIELRVATSGAKFATLDPDTEGDGTGGFAFLKLGSGAQVPYAIANTAACNMEIFIVST